MQRILEESETLNTSVGDLICVQQVPFFSALFYFRFFLFKISSITISEDLGLVRIFFSFGYK